MPLTFNTISEADILRSPGGRTMIDAINYSGPKNLILTGCPGSGKTTVAIMRAVKLQAQGHNILLVTYQNLLKVNLANMCGKPMWGKISGFYDWYVKQADGRITDSDTATTLLKRIETLTNYDEIPLDEGQDLEERFLRTLIGKANRISIGADTAQKKYMNMAKQQSRLLRYWKPLRNLTELICCIITAIILKHMTLGDTFCPIMTERTTA